MGNHLSMLVFAIALPLSFSTALIQLVIKFYIDITFAVCFVLILAFVTFTAARPIIWVKPLLVSTLILNACVVGVFKSLYVVFEGLLNFCIAFFCPPLIFSHTF